MKQLQADAVVIGGGATGAGAVRDLAMRGFSAVLLERADLAQGTSARFHGLLHSGGRYVISDPESATECAEENEIVRRIHPRAVEDTGGLFIVTPYDTEEHADQFLSAAAATRVPAAEITIAQALKREPRLHPKMKRAFEVHDASVDGWALVWGAAESAKAYGAKILPYHRATKIIVKDGCVAAVRAHGEKTGEDIQIDCRFVINCGGPWAGQIAALAGVQGVDVIPGRGIMVAMNHRLVNTVINRCVYPADGDIIVPAHTVCIIGTTDEAAANPDFLEIKHCEVQQMLDAGEAMIPGFRQARALHAWAGARPLVRDSRVSATDTRHMSRGMSIIDHRLRDGISGLLTIAGGKLTTYRLMAKNVVDAMCDQLGEVRPCRTALEEVPSSHTSNKYGLPSAGASISASDGAAPAIQQSVRAGKPQLHKVSDRLAQRESDRLIEAIICECELVTRSMIEKEIEADPSANIDDLRRKLRIGMGPCQGTFCALRTAGIMHEKVNAYGELERARGESDSGRSERSDHSGRRADRRERAHRADRTIAMMRLFLGNRKQGLDPLLYGEQLREAALQKWVVEDSLDLLSFPMPSEASRKATGDMALVHGRHDGLCPTGMERPTGLEAEGGE